MVLTILRLALIATAIWAAFMAALRLKGRDRRSGFYLLGAMAAGLVAVAL